MGALQRSHLFSKGTQVQPIIREFDGVVVKALACRSSSAHWIEFVEPFQTTFIAVATSWYGSKVYAEQLKTRTSEELFRESYDLVKMVYLKYKALKHPSGALLEEYRQIRSEWVQAYRDLEELLAANKARRRSLTRLLNAGIIGKAEHRNRHDVMRDTEKAMKEASEQAGSAFIEKNFKGYPFCAEAIFGWLEAKATSNT
jgi:hypothetical protein